MPTVRKLEPDEVRAIESRGKGTRKLIEEQYDEFLRDYLPGDYGEVDLEEGDNRLTVRNRLKAAAGRRNMGLEFRRTRGPLLRFRVLSGAEAQAGDAAGAETPPRPARARGPRRKNP
jgi:hypothetical protein